MKTIELLFVLFVVVMTSTNNAQGWSDCDNHPAEDGSMHPDTIPGSNWKYPTIFNWNYENIGNPGVNSGSVGAMYFQNKYYFNKWNSKIIYRYNGGIDGPGLFLDSISYIGSIRDLATDGKYLYGGAATNKVFIFDSLGVTIDSITLGSPAIARAIAYTVDENGFFVCNSNDNIILCDAITGAVKRVLNGTNTLTGKYGLAYSDLPPEGPILWVWGQGTTNDPYNNLWKLNPATGDTITKYRFGPLQNVTGTTSLKGVAGGAELCIIDRSPVLLLNYQNYALIGYRLGEALPVVLLTFTGNTSQNNVILNWSTATEINNHGFEIQRNLTDRSFKTIAFINGAGTSAETHNYTFTDKVPGAGKYTYRLRQVDFDGHSEYSKSIEVKVNHPTKFELIQNYPNPFNPSTIITYILGWNSKVSVKIYNLLGQEVAILINGEVSAGTHSIKFDASSIVSGIYMYELVASGKDGSTYSEVKKMIYVK